MQVSEKETRAVFLNFKELRCLEKSVQSLDLEKAYSVSLINLEQKVVKVRDKKTRDRVSKIRSHLSQEHIDEMKRLDDEGKLGIPESSSKLDSSLRIAAAAKRLKLLPRAKSAVPRLNMGGVSEPKTPTRTPRSPVPSSRAKTPIPVVVEPDDNLPNFPVPRSVRVERRNSISIRLPGEGESVTTKMHVPKIAFEDTVLTKKDVPDKGPTPRVSSRKTEDENKSPTSRSQLSDDLSDKFYLQIPEETGPTPTQKQAPLSPTSARPTNGKIRPVSVPATQISDFGQIEKQKRPATTNPKAMEVRRKSVAEIRRASMLIKSGRTTVPFSSHEKKKKQSDLEKPYRSIRDGAMSAINLDTKDNDIGNELFKAIKQGMLLGEVANSLCIEDKIDSFIENVDQYKKDNPTHFQPTDLSRPATGKKKDKDVRPVRNVLRRRELELQLQDVEARKRLADEMWNNVNKCRYLRVSDDNLDLSGINTLVVDQMKMTRRLKHGTAS